MSDQMKVILLILFFVILVAIIVIITIIMIKRKNTMSQLAVDKKLYDLPSNSPNVQLFGIDTKNKPQKQFSEEELAKTQIISVSDMVEVNNIQEIKNINIEENNELPKLK